MERSRGKALVTVSQIATLAEVGPSAVSNWRRRFVDFPAPAQAAPGGRDLFELDQVERWLASHDRLRQDSGKLLLFAAADRLRSEAPATQMVEVLGAALALVASGEHGVVGTVTEPPLERLARASDAEVLDPAYRPLLRIDRALAEDIVGLMADIDRTALSDCFEWILSQGGKQHAGQNDSGNLGDLISAIVGETPAVVYDPAAGWGGFLHSLSQQGTGPQLYGQEVNESTLTITRQRFLVDGIPVSLALGDSLIEDAWPNLRADVIVSDPPYGVRKDWPPGARWTRGTLPHFTDFAWLQHVAHHLATNGRGYVFLAINTLSRRGKDANLRRELLAEGLIEGIVALPSGSTPRASIPLALWILRKPGVDSRGSPVLMIDATAATRSSPGPLSPTEKDRIAAIVRAWRDSGEVPAGDRALAASVSALDLLRRDANLNPARWTSSTLTGSDRRDREHEAQHTREALEEWRRALAVSPATRKPSTPQRACPWIGIDQLLDDGVAKILRGVRITSDKYSEHGVPIIRAEDLKNSFPETAVCFVEPASLQPKPPLTRAGDVVVAPQGDRVRAIVDPVGGWALAAPLQALRLLDSLIEPRLAAAFLESPHNRRLLTSRMAIPFRELEVPLLPREDARELLEALEGLDDQQHLAEKIELATRGLRELYLTLAITPSEVDEDDLFSTSEPWNAL